MLRNDNNDLRVIVSRLRKRGTCGSQLCNCWLSVSMKPLSTSVCRTRCSRVTLRRILNAAYTAYSRQFGGGLKLTKGQIVKHFITQVTGGPLSGRLPPPGPELVSCSVDVPDNDNQCVVAPRISNMLYDAEKQTNPNGNVPLEANLNTTDGVSTRSAVIIIASIFVISILSLGYIYFKFPELEPEEKRYIKLPWDVEEAKNLGRVLEKHKDRNYYEVLAAIIVTYIFLQTFAIPGSISLSILSGFLFPFPLALGLVCFCSATGASFCYLLSHLAGRRLVYKYFPDRAIKYSLTVQKHRRNIFNYILFLRITPFLPNWFINIAAPIVDVPILPFWLGTFLGVAPPSFVAIQAGQTLQQLTSMSGTWSWTSVTWLAVFSLLSLAPVLLRNRLRNKFD